MSATSFAVSGSTRATALLKAVATISRIRAGLRIPLYEHMTGHSPLALRGPTAGSIRSESVLREVIDLDQTYTHSSIYAANNGGVIAGLQGGYDRGFGVVLGRDGGQDFCLLVGSPVIVGGELGPVAVVQFEGGIG